MSGIVLTASVRQNLLALQSTASLLAKTQNDLATGNKVNTALDNPTNFFTAQGLNNRASDIDNLSGAAAITTATLLSGTAASGSNDLASGITTGDTLTVDGVTFTFVAGS